MIVALFTGEAALSQALLRLREAAIGPLETYTPAPLPHAEEGSPVPVAILSAGLLGAAASFGLQSYSYEWAYPFPIGGRPQVAWPSFIPTVFENAVLLAVVCGFVAFMVVNRMPRLYAPIDEAAVMRQASRDGWVLAIETRDPAMLSRARSVLAEFSPARVEELP